jgi:hypothetical protein
MVSIDSQLDCIEKPRRKIKHSFGSVCKSNPINDKLTRALMINALMD